MINDLLNKISSTTSDFNTVKNISNIKFEYSVLIIECKEYDTVIKKYVGKCSIDRFDKFENGCIIVPIASYSAQYDNLNTNASYHVDNNFIFVSSDFECDCKIFALLIKLYE